MRSLRSRRSRPTSHPHRVDFVGVTHWCRHLADTLGSADPSRTYVAITARQLLSARCRESDVVRVGFRPGSLTLRGFLFDVVWAAGIPRARRHTYWIGTDVAHTLDEADVHAIRRRWRRRLAGRSACGAPWFVEELARAGIDADAVRFPYGEDRPAEWPGWPGRFAVSIYLPSNKPVFYGADVLDELARSTPEIAYQVYGSANIPERPNIERCGFVDDFSTALTRSVVHLRLTQHDAIAGTVRDSLLLGRYVIFGYELPGVTVVDVRDAAMIAMRLRELKSRFDRGALDANRAGLDYASAMSAAQDALALVRWLDRSSDEDHPSRA